MRRTLTVAGTAIVLGAIGGNDFASAGIDGGGAPNTSKGAVTQFSSVYVNGVRFDTASALFFIDGELGAESDLAVGQVVTVIGTTDSGGATGTAYVVIYEDVVSGPVTEISPQQGRMTVLGHTVVVNSDTSFSVPGVDSIEDLGLFDTIEISGYAGADGTVLATHIAAADAGEFDVTGVVTGVDNGQLNLSVGGLEVDYRAANLLGFPAGFPAIGDRVEIRGGHLGSSGEFVANRVENMATTIAAFPGDDVALEGLITRYRAPWDFDVDGTRVTIDWGTRFENGWLFDLGENVKVEIQGSLGGDYRLYADRIEFESASSAELAAHISDLTHDSITVGGQTIFVHAETEYEDSSDEDTHRFGIEDLRSSDRVRVRYYVENGESIATRIERLDGDDGDDEYEEEEED